jgi:Cellulase (glycosyl hydrolase family 5)
MTVLMRIVTTALTAAAASAVAAGVAGCSFESETREATARAAARARPARLHATARHAFVRQSGTPVRLNGVNVVPVWADSPGRTWSAARYDAIARKGFNSVRFVLYWADFEPRRGVFESRALGTLDTAVARAKAAGLYVVLDMIHLWGTGGLRDVPGWAVSGDSVATVRENAGPYVRMLARHYRDEPTVAAYDPVSEPHRWPIDQNAVLRMYDDLIGAIRDVDPAKVVMVEPSYGDSSIAGACADLSNLKHRSNVVFSIHAYFAGGDDDGFGPDCRQTGRYAWDPNVGYDAADPAPLRAHLRSYLDVLAPQGIPLYVGEFGMGRLAPNRDRWIGDMVGLLNEFGLGRAWWEYSTQTNDGAFSATYPDGGWRPFTSLLVAEPGPAPAQAPAPAPAGDPVVMAAGDFQGHRGAGGRAGDVAAVVRAADPDVVLGLGDYQYQYGTLAALQAGFDRNFGDLKPRFRPTAGPTHDVADASDTNGGYVQYWNRAPFEPYSFDLGSWHVVQLPSAAYRYGVDTAHVLSWLEADLATSTKPCTLAFWHEPYWSLPTTGHSRTTAVRPWVQALYDHDAEIILNGHQHNYQRFAPQAPDDQSDPSRGIRQFIVGTGGIGTYGFTGTAPNVEASDATTYGALKLTLHERGYDWSFERAAGGSFTDAGSGSCH